MQLDLPAILRNRFWYASALLRDERQVEMRQAHVGFLRQCRADLALRGVDVSPPQSHDRQRIACGERSLAPPPARLAPSARPRRARRGRGGFPPPSNGPAHFSDPARKTAAPLSPVFKGAYSQYYEAAEAQLFERGVPRISDYVTYDVSGRTKEEIE